MTLQSTPYLRLALNLSDEIVWRLRPVPSWPVEALDVALGCGERSKSLAWRMAEACGRLTYFTIDGVRHVRLAADAPLDEI